MNMTRRDTLARAIALLCGLGAAEAEARSGMTGESSPLRKALSFAMNEGGPGLAAPPGALDGDEPGLQSGGPSETGSEAQGGERAGADLVFRHDLPNISLDDWEVTVGTVDYAPGRVGKVHHHAGFVLAYVLEGNIVTKISGQDERTYKPGEMFFEPPGSTHEVSRNASETRPAKLLALIFAKKGEQLTMPGPA
jgi:quercetin dioxygenase-like cupin family protein